VIPGRIIRSRPGGKSLSLSLSLSPPPRPGRPVVGGPTGTAVGSRTAVGRSEGPYAPLTHAAGRRGMWPGGRGNGRSAAGCRGPAAAPQARPFPADAAVSAERVRHRSAVVLCPGSQDPTRSAAMPQPRVYRQLAVSLSMGASQADSCKGRNHPGPCSHHRLRVTPTAHSVGSSLDKLRAAWGNGTLCGNLR
jgi:hypothetical protein